MAIKDKMLQLLELHQDNETGLDVNYIAETLGIWRHEALEVLNELVGQALVSKRGSKPIYYRLKKADESGKKEGAPPPFWEIIGAYGSLKYQTQLACAAASYPPDGIHTLLIGETGVGKSLLASEMARYMAQTRGQAEEAAPFVIVNCAEYADNPQLLLSHLFGHKKGSFTGAVSDKSGLVEKADKGILFLDEIHRLHPTGQEMLFSIIDRGVYRRLGGLEDLRVRLMIIGATTENPSSVLLSTFQRRMPFTIHIPPLAERPINERLDLVARFLSREAHHLKMPIRISFLVLKLLVAARSEYNIGDLKNEIQTSCARCYLEHMAEKQNRGGTLNLDIYGLSRSLSLRYTQDERLDRYFSEVGLHNGLTIYPEKPAAPFPSLDSDGLAFDLTRYIETKITSYTKLGKDLSEAESLVVSELKNHYKSNQETYDSDGSVQSLLYGAITPSVWTVTNMLVQKAAEELGRPYSQGNVNTIAYYLQQLKAYANAGRMIFSPAYLNVADDFPKETALIKKLLPMIRNVMGIEIVDGEIMLLSMLLAQEASRLNRPNINLLIVGHNNIAAGIAGFANGLLNTSFIKALDIPTDMEQEAAMGRLNAIMKNDKKDTIVLSVLGMSSFIEREFYSAEDINCLVLPTIDPIIALECGKLILSSDKSMEEIIRIIINEYHDYIEKPLREIMKRLDQYPSPPRPPETDHDRDTREVIITYCVTGMGSARTAREILIKNFALSQKADILPLGIADDIFAASKRLGKRLKLIIGIMDPEIEGVPFLSIEHILYSNDQQMVLSKSGINLPSRDEADAEEVKNMPLHMRLMQIKHHLNYFAPTLDPDKVDAGVRRVIESISAMYSTDLSPDLIVRIYIHSVSMFERLASLEPIPMPLDGYAVVEDNNRMFLTIKEILKTACGELHLKMVDAEVYYFMITLPNPKTMIESW